uniref:THUMP domain-containing protein n=1 Tax=Strigamia maritima TaxID=126957 RepID=T1JFX0_STRMM
MVASEPFRFPGLLPENANLCTIEATVTTGLEAVAAEECSKKFETNVMRTRGRIGFDIEIDKVKEVLELKCIDNVSVLIGEVENIKFKETKEECLQQIQDTFTLFDWRKGLLVWSKMTDFDIALSENVEDLSKMISGEKEELSFRVTCTRVGQKHKFQSPDAGKVMGAIVNDTFGWKVDLTAFNIEVLLNICGNYIYIGLSLVKESLHKRNLHYFGRATLRPTISHCMLRLACIESGDVVCDPVCGSGSIVVEGILNWPNAFHLGGDIHDVAYNRTKQNIDALKSQKCLPVNIFHWDATRLPMLDNSIDAIVTDLVIN